MEEKEQPMRLNKLILWALIASGFFYGCKEPKQGQDNPEKPKIEAPAFTVSFSADSAYQYIQDQVDFGPRVPQSAAHAECAYYLESQLNRFCDTGFIQEATITHKGKALPIKNIIGVFNPEATKRILLCAHWDTRPQADEDEERPTEPADGANDGGSGVGVLLEVARQLSLQIPDEGVDIVFFDAEDMGDRMGRPETWCLGSQYWAKRPHKENYVARFGILLDMVGPENPVFAIEGYSWQYAQPYVKKVWGTANKLGYGKYFVNYRGGSITDDHVFINQIAGIPTLNIIHYDESQGGFGDFWHTHEDNMETISKETLKAVGETVFTVVKEF